MATVTSRENCLKIYITIHIDWINHVRNKTEQTQYFGGKYGLTRAEMDYDSSNLI